MLVSFFTSRKRTPWDDISKHSVKLLLIIDLKYYSKSLFSVVFLSTSCKAQFETRVAINVRLTVAQEIKMKLSKLMKCNFSYFRVNWLKHYKRGVRERDRRLAAMFACQWITSCSSLKYKIYWDFNIIQIYALFFSWSDDNDQVLLRQN